MAFAGNVVSIDCGDAMGTYQGIVVKVDTDENSITITKPFKNGSLCMVPQVTIRAQDIHDLKILKNSQEAQSMPEIRHKPATEPAAPRIPEGNVAPARASSAELRNERSSPFDSPSVNQRNKSRRSPTKPIQYHQNGARQKENYESDGSENYRHQNGLSPTKTYNQRTSSPRKMDTRRGRHQREDCFSAPVDSFLGDDFDFEKNLALFDKRAVFREIEDHAGYESPKQQNERNPTKYKCDENVLDSGPVIYKQIEVGGEHTDQRYVTDTGMVVPSISYQTRCKLFAAAESHGFSKQRQLEMIGRSASEMVMQLVGGVNRFNPTNAHQRPLVVVLCGPHLQGAQGVNCARHLASHNVDVTVFVPNFVKVIDLLEEELKLFILAGGKKTSSLKDLHNSGLDIIVNALDNHENRHLLSGQTWFKTMTSWANNSMASVLSIDPPVEGCSINTKWSLSLGLPLALSDRCGQVYLCDVGIPVLVFRECAITYCSPFANKFVVPLHLAT